MDDALRRQLVDYIRRKFASSPNVRLLSEDVVHEAVARVMRSPGFTPDKLNFGYLSVTAVRLAYRLFMRQAKAAAELTLDYPGAQLLDEAEVAGELMAAEDTGLVLASLATLRDIERIVVTQRYYGDLSFAEIAAANGLKLNTVLSHHRRALARLRPRLNALLGYGKEEDEND